MLKVFRVYLRENKSFSKIFFSQYLKLRSLRTLKISSKIGDHFCTVWLRFGGITLKELTISLKSFSVWPRIGPNCGTHTSSAIQTHLIIGYCSTHDFLHLEDFRHSDVEFCLESEFH